MLSQLFATACVVCGQSCANNYSICSDCESALPRMQTSCQRCGTEQWGSALIDISCGNCLLNPPAFNFCRSVFAYVSPIDKLVTNFKFRAQFDSGYSLSKILAREMQIYYSNQQKPQVLIPVPLHRNRLRIRGFNQAIEIGRVVSRQCQIPLAYSAISKIRDTTPQIELSSAQSRKTNLSNAFAVADQSLLRNVNFVAILDDVVTTMTTVAAITKVLQQHGVRRVDVWCLARASR
jgi:ComF family protein